MTRGTMVPIGLLGVVLAVSLAGCVVPTGEAAPERTADVSADIPTAAPSESTPVSPTSTPTTVPEDPRDTEYRADVAGWTDPIPPGFAWPVSITALPAGRWHGKGDWSGYTTALGIYHCMLVHAAWDAYFTDNDPIASKAFAAHADATMPDQDYPTWVTRDDGTIRDADLASESGICNGFVGELRQ